jgi:FtsP/CotA-like multicopper oxidase with cupredoxin domain
MKKTGLVSAILLAMSISTLSGCGGGSTTSISTSTLTGSIFKGPVHAASVQITDQAGGILSSSSSDRGKFTLGGIRFPDDESQAIFVESQGGNYTDEATGSNVDATGKGLMTVYTVAELKSVIAANRVIALTPETTLLAKLVKTKLQNNITATQAISDARQTIQTQLINGTNPAMGVQGDTLLTEADLSTDTPADTTEALARNRAISFSYEALSLNLSPVQVFDLIDKRAQDLEDGQLDGKNDAIVLTLRDKDGNDKDLSNNDQKNSYGMARTRLLNATVARIGRGEINPRERARLEKMGFNLDYFDTLRQRNQQAERKTQENLAATNLPAFNHLPVLTDEDGNPSDNAATYTLTATENVDVTINVPGDSWVTPMLRYNGSELPPVIRAKRGDSMTLNLINNLSDDTTIHWHGFKIPGDQDGGPDYPVSAGNAKTYSFAMLQPAAPLWFHPHPDMQTGEQVYRGLAGVFLLEDAISQQLASSKQIPSGDADIPVLIQDRRFRNEVNGVRQLAYKTMEMDSDGMLGDRILVNGAELPKLEVGTRQYRLRLYNTSNARSYDFALSDGSTFRVVGTDGGLLPQPVEVDHIMLGAAERAEIVIDFSRYTVGNRVMLISKAFNGSPMMGMMSGMNGGGSGGGMNGGTNTQPANGMRMDIMRFDVATQISDDVTLYSALPAGVEINPQRLTAQDATKTRNFVMTMAMGNMNGGGSGRGSGGGSGGGMAGMSFVINGKAFDMNRIDELVNLSEGDTEIWSIQNRSPMAHPFHAHAIQWQILSRNGIPASGIDLGWKDTVLVQPGETVNFIGRFDPAVNTGDYMYHCHILEHEDAGMMGFFRIQ